MPVRFWSPNPSPKQPGLGHPRIIVADMAAPHRVSAVFTPPAAAVEGIHPSAQLGANVQIAEGSRSDHLSSSRTAPGSVGDPTRGRSLPSLPKWRSAPTAARSPRRLLSRCAIGGPGLAQSRSSDWRDWFSSFRPQGHQRMPHQGSCILEDDVEVGSHSCIRSRYRLPTPSSDEAPRSTTWCRSAIT